MWTLKEIEFHIGKENISEFLAWMDGQTYTVIDGIAYYYNRDVSRFVRILQERQQEQQ